MRNSTLSLLLAAPLVFVGCSDSDNDTSSSTANSLGQSLANRGYPTLQAAIDAAGLADTLTNGGPFTLLAPSEAAFAALPAGTLDFLLDPANQDTLREILLYHVIDGEADSSVVSGLTSATSLQGGQLLIDSVGGDLFVNEAIVQAADIMASNGIIHELDTVLLPPQSVVDTLVDRGFTTLVAAVQAADLAMTLSGPGPFTVLAPTNQAFANLPAGVLDDLLMPANQAQLVDVLTYHVVSGTVRASEAVAAETPKGLNGVTLLFDGGGAAPTVNEVRIEMINIPCTNGVIHVLDAVLVPPGDIPTVATEGGFSTLVAALTAADLVDDLQAAGPFTVFAPTDAAFADLPPGVLDDLLLPQNQQQLIDILLYHVVADELTANEVLANSSLMTLQGASLDVSISPVTVGGSTLAATNVLARNGIVHAVDSVLLPPIPFLNEALRGETSQAIDFESAAVEATVSSLQAPLGQGSEPLWSGDPAVQEVRFDHFDLNQGQPLRDENAQTALLATGLGVERNSSGVLRTTLDGEVRWSLGWSSVPQAVQLDVRSESGSFDTPQLVLVFASGETQVLAPAVLRSAGATDRSFDWQASRAGEALIGADLVLPLAKQGATLQGLRLFTLPR